MNQPARIVENILMDEAALRSAERLAVFAAVQSFLVAPDRAELHARDHRTLLARVRLARIGKAAVARAFSDHVELVEPVG